MGLLGPSRRMLGPTFIARQAIKPFRQLSTEVKQKPENSSTPSSVLVEHRGPLSDSYTRLKKFSLSSMGLAAVFTPLMFVIDSAVPTGGRFILGLTALSTSGLSTALIAWAGSSYVTNLRVESQGPNGAGRRIHFTTTTILLKNLNTVVYDPLFLERAEEYLVKVKLRQSIRIPMAEVQKKGMKLVHGSEETVAETFDSNGNVKGWWEVRWRQEGDAGFVGECRSVGKVIR
ncbi:7359_t:CDS:1 [Acaulospora colombiana]|uniref:7359_t:CDS:1 n=1 Tax=Acaulospora colombiana TaxID=27376 RepID=A0ACA9NA70_9GLOM|nr:7359_t:CDS:1 [Acaulospora colombiana]